MWLFELLLRLYPAGFRAEYGDAMRLDAREEAAASGRLGFLFWLLADFARSWPQVLGQELAQDVRYCFRTWGRRPGLAVMAVLVLGMAIGASTGVFSVVNAMLFRSLPFREPERLVQFENYFAPAYGGEKKYLDWKRAQTYLSDIGVFCSSEFNLQLRQTTLRVKGAETTANFFELLGTPLYLGRGFLPEETQPGKGDVAILSHALFEQAFGGDMRVVGQKIVLTGRPLTVIGVAMPGFDFPQNAALWMPTGLDPGRIAKSGIASTTTVGRLRAGITMEAAQSEFRIVSKRHVENVFGEAEGDFTFKMNPLREQLAGEMGRASQVLLLGVCAVMLIACVNLANLFLSRFAERRQEFDIRSWLGAGAPRLRQQIITECVLLSLAAGLVSIAFAWLVAQIVSRYLPPVLAFQSYEVLDWRVLGFALAVALASGVGFGLMPSWLRLRKLSLVLLAGQTALTAVLLLGSVDLGNAVLRLNQLNFGFNADRLYTATVSMAGSTYETAAGEREYLRRSIEAVERLGVAEAVGAIDFMPLATNTFSGASFQMQTREKPQLTVLLSASPGMIAATGGQLLAGRDFAASDTANAPRVVLVNETFAKLDGGVHQVIGRKLRSTMTMKDPERTIIGVVRDFRFASGDSAPTVITAFAQVPHNFFTVAARVRPGQEAKVPLLMEKALSGIDASVPVYDVMPMSKRVERVLARPNFYGIAMLFFGGFSLLLTMVHGYSLCASAIERRRRELGIRAALGATTEQLRWMLLREIAPAIVAGVALGALFSSYTLTVLTWMSDGLQAAPQQWRALGMTVLIVTCALAVWWKSRVLTRMDPMEQIRQP